MEANGNDAGERPDPARARVLVVEDEVPHGRCLQRAIERCGGTAILVGTAHDAAKHLAQDVSWTALILDVALPDGSGLDILGDVRRRGWELPALVLTGLLDRYVAKTAFELGAKYLVKPVEPGCVEMFFLQVVHQAATRLQRVLDDWIVRFGLSEAETQILLLAAEGCDREAIATARRCSQETVKKHFSHLREKTRSASLLEVVQRLLRDTLNS